MTEKQRRKKIAKLALKLYLAVVAGGGNPTLAGCLKEAGDIYTDTQACINEASEPEPEPEPETDSLDLSWAKWVATDATEAIFAYKYKPTKSVAIWKDEANEYTCITPGQAIALCGRVPQWSDEEPTPVKTK